MGFALRGTHNASPDGFRRGRRTSGARHADWTHLWPPGHSGSDTDTCGPDAAAGAVCDWIAPKAGIVAGCLLAGIALRSVLAELVRAVAEKAPAATPSAGLPAPKHATVPKNAPRAMPAGYPGDQSLSTCLGTASMSRSVDDFSQSFTEKEPSALITTFTSTQFRVAPKRAPHRLEKMGGSRRKVAQR